MANENRLKLFKALDKAGYDIGNYDDFDRRMNNAQDRDKFFTAIGDAGFDIGDRDEFERRISPTKYKLKVNGEDVGVSEKEYKDFVSRHTPSADQTIDDVQRTLNENQRVMNRIGNRQQRIGLNTGKPVQIGGTGFRLGENRKVTQGPQRYNADTGQMEQTFVTEAGNEYGSRELADLEQNAVDQAEWDATHPKESLKSSIDSQIAQLEEQIAAMTGAGGAPQNVFSNMYSGGVGASVRQTEYDQRLSDLTLALKDLQDARTMMERNEQLHASSDFLGGIGIPGTKDFFNNWKNFGYGIWDTLSDPGLYDFGITDLAKAGKYSRIKQKIENGEELSDQETALALAGMAKSHAEQLATLPHGYTAGVTTTEMAPFMIQMAMNPGSGIGRGFARKAVRQFGRNGLKAVSARVGARVLGNLGEAAVLSNTLQAGNTLANIMQRYNGDTFEYDEDGNLRMGYYEEGPDGEPQFVEGGKSALRSIYEGEASSIIENFTELGTGGSINKMLSKAAASKMGQKFGLGYISGLVGKVGSTPFAKNMKRFMERTHWDGMIEEPLEEEYGIILNSFLGTGDAKISDLWDGEKQADIFAGTMWFGGFMAGMNTAAYPVYRHQIKKQLQVADQNGEAAFGEEWPVMKDAIDMMDDKDVASYLYSIKDNDAFNNEQKAALFGYSARLKQYQGAEVADMLSRMEGNLSADEASIRNAYDTGAEAETPDEMKQYADEAKEAEAALPQYGQEFATMIIAQQDNPANALDYLMQHRDLYTDEQIAAAADYYQKQTRADGMMDATLDKVDLEVEKANAEVRANTHQQSGNIIMGKMGDQDYYIIGGELTTDPDTGLTSLTGTGGAVILKDPITGEVTVQSASAVIPYSMQSADELIEQNETVLRQQLMHQANDDITYGSPANEVYELDDTVALRDEAGNIVEGQIGMMPNSVDGVYVVYTNDGKALQMTADDLNRRIVAHNGQEVKPAEVAVPQQPAGQPAEQNGNISPENIPAEGNNSVENIPEQPQSALSRIPVKTDAEGRPLTSKKGNPILDWHKASVEDTTDALIETTGGDMLTARDTATDMANVARGRLEKIRKQKPKGEDPFEIAESRMEIRQAEAEQQAIIQHWQKVNQEIQRRMTAASNERRAAEEAAKTAEQRAKDAEIKRQQEETERQRRREQIERDKAQRNKPYAPLVRAKKEVKDIPDAEAILEDTEPRDLMEWVSSLLTPHTFMWEDEKIGEHTITGLQSELGLQKKDFERIGKLLASREDGGKPFAEVVDGIREGLPEAMKEQYTDQDVRNALLELFNEGNVERMLHLTEEHRMEEAREMVKEYERRAQEYEMEAWAEHYHLSPEEREAFEEFMQQPPLVPEQEVINQIIADYESDRTSPAVGEQPVSGTDAAGVEGGESQVQQAAEAASIGDNAEAVAQGQEAATGEQAPSDNNVAGGEQVDRNTQGRRYVDLRANLKYFLNTIGIEDDGIVDRMSNYEVDQLVSMIEEWEARNSDYGEVIEQTKHILSRRRKPSKVVDKEFDDAKAKVEEAQARANEAFEPIEQYVEGLQAKYGELYPTEGAIPTPEIDNPRYTANRQALIDAYKSGDPSAITAAAQAIQQYVDEGLDAGEDKSNMMDEAEDYEGNDPEKLADQYIVRVFWDRYLDDDVDKEYIRTGLKPSMRETATAQPQSTEPYTSFEEMAADTHETVTDPAMQKALRKIVDKQFVHGSSNHRTDPRGFEYVFVYMADGTTKADRGMLQPWESQNPVEYNDDNPTATWIDEKEQRVYFIKYNPPGAVYGWDFIIAGYKQMPKPLGTTSSPEQIAQEEAKVDTNPSEAQKKEKPAAKPAGTAAQPAKKKAEKQHKRIVSDDQMKELRKKLLEKFGQANAGIDVERMLLGAMYAVGKIERGVTKFADYAREMVDEIGDSIRPYLKAFYNAVRDMPEAAEYRDQMDTPEYVEAFDVDNFDKKVKVPDAITKAEQVVRNEKAKKQVKKVEKEVKQKIQQGDLFAGDLFGEQEETVVAQQPTQQQPKEEKKRPKNPWWSDENRPASLDPSDYRTYMTPEAKEYFANYPIFAGYKRNSLAFVTAAVWDGVELPPAELKKLPEIIEAEQVVKDATANGVLEISDEERDIHAQHLLDAEHGSAVFENGKIRKVNGVEDFSGPVRQERKALVIIGLPAGGKSSVFANPLSNQYGARIIDSDVVKPWLEGFDDGNGAGYVQNASSDVAERALDIAVGNGDNVILPRIGGDSVIRLSAALRLAGYDVQLYYNDVKTTTSVNRAASRFADTGRYLSLDYLTSKDGVPSKNFSNFAEKTIGDYLDELSEGEIQKLRRRLERLLESEDSDGTGLRKPSANTQGGYGTLDEYVSALLESGRAGESTGTSDLSHNAPIFSYAEWKSNDVAFGEKPKEIWNSKSGKPMPGKKEVKNNGNKQEVSRKPESAGEGAGQTSGTAERTGTERSPEPNRAERSRSGHSVETQPAKPKQEPKKNLRNNQGERGKDYAPTSPKARFNANVEAIKLMRQLMDDGIEAPTKEQMETLRQYSGWGGLGTYFNDESSAENKILRDLLSDEEYNDAVMSINSAYFTPATVIDSMWDIAEAMGFKGGNVLEGSAGIGNIIGQMPKKLSSKSDIEAVEIDKISGNILKLLYPDAKVNVQGFQDTMIRNGSVDLAITNVPFVTGLHVFDKVDKDLSRRFANIHDFCIAKNIRKLREGGIGIFISSSGTLDKSNDLRAWITDEGQADVVGAFRLNNETFGGTTATSDIIVVRKRVGNKKSPNAIDISAASPMRVGSYEDKYGDSHQTTMTVNDYFKEHPEMMAGEMAFGYEKGDTFRPGSYGLYPVEGKNQDKMLADFAKSMSKAKEEKPAANATATVAESVPNQLTMVKEGRMLIDDNGRLCVSQYGEAVPLNLNANKVKGYTKEQCFKDYQEVQKAVDDVLQQQLNDPDDAALKPKLDALNRAYDKFVNRYGYLHKNTAIAFLRNDIDFPTFQELEKYSETKDMKGKVTVTTKKSPIFTQRVLGFKTEPKPKTIKDALIASIFKTNSIDLEWITSKLNEVAAPPNGDNWTTDDVRKGILVSRLGFENPSTGQLEVRHTYLSGNVREKLAIAEEYNASGETAGRYAANVEELRKVVPMDIPAHLIDFTLGSSWIPNELYIDYLRSEYGLPENIKLTHLQGSWVLDVNKWSANNETNKSKGVYSQKFRSNILGTDLVVAALNNRPYKVSKQETIGYGSDKTTRTVVDQEATSACNVRIEEIKDGFKQYIRKRVQEDTDLARRIEKIYNDKFNALVPLRIDDEMLPERFEDANMNISLYDHQKRGVLRGVTSPTMLAHEVGTGKSFTLISTAMEMRRLGTAKKPMIVVQNATVAQMTADAKLLYPNAKVLSLSEKDRDAEGRRAFYAKIRFNDWDMIIIPQSTLDMIPDSPERELQFIQEQIDEKKHVIEQARAAKMDKREIERLERELAKKEQQYGDTYLDNDPANNSQMAAAKKGKKRDAKREAASLDKAETKAREKLDRAVDDVQYFDDLGVDAILVDEAHGYKHLGFETTLGRSVKGVDPSYSKKCAGLYNKTRSVFERAGWKNVVFATGTPISNTAAEIWTFMKYLMPADVMKANDIYYFDDFVHNFGSINQMLEFKTNGKFNEVTRFAAYVNRPELMRIWMQVADIVRTEEVGEVKSKVPEKEHGKDQDVFLPQSPSLVSIMAAVRAELERFEKMDGKEKRENSSIPLTMYGIAKRAAIDPRLVDATAPDEPKSKTNAAVKEIVKDLEATKKYKGTVAVFCDNQNRKGANGAIEFNIFDDMKEKLVKQGVPEAQIAIIKSSMSITAKQKIFDKVNTGDVRVILGSTQTLGTGVNIQERLHLLIHMDAPDRPMDYTQRNGRIERQGNLHKEWGLPIRILRFGVEDSLDVTAYQRLKTKSGFIDSIMSGKSALANNQTDRTIEEEEEGLFDNPVAVLSGSQFALKKNQAERQLRKMQGKYNAWEADQIYVSSQLRTNEAWIKNRRVAIDENEQALARMREMFPNGKVKTITVEGVAIDMTKDDGAKKLGEAIKEKINDPVNATVKKLRENQIYNDETQHYTIELDGHKVNFEVAISRTSEWDYNVNKMRTVVHKNTSYKSPDLRIEDGTGLSSSKSVKEHLDNILDQYVTGDAYVDAIDAAKASIERVTAESAQLKKREGQPFQFTDELEQAKKQVEEYTSLMKKEMQEKEAKYAEQAKEAGDNGGFDLKKAEESEEDDTLYSADEDWDEPIFYSNAMRAVEGIRQEKATPEQWLKMIEKAGGLKAAEDKWLRLSEQLNDAARLGIKTVTKDAILNYIRDHQIEIEEVSYQEGMSQEAQDKLDELNREFQELIWESKEATNSIYTSDWVDAAYEQMVDRYGDDFRNAFDVGEGTGTNSRLTPIMDWNDQISPVAKYFLGMDGDSGRPINDTRLDYTTEGLKNKREIALTVPTIEPYNENDEIHFGDAGDGRAVAWVRFGETTDADGNKVLVIDEIQSKRHQDGREGGYKGDVVAENREKAEKMRKRHQELIAKRDELIDRDNKIRDAIRDTDEAKSMIGEDGYILEGKVNDWQAMFDNNKELDDVDKQRAATVREIQELEQEMRQMNNEVLGKVPDAPFEKNWHELAMKRMLRYAAENGHDKVAWTTGAQQAERYNIGNVVKNIMVAKSLNNESWKTAILDINGYMIGFDVDENGIVRATSLPKGNQMNDTIGKPFSEVVGKELALKVLSSEDGTKIEGDGLHIGGEGMKGFYDQMLPRFMDKYGKKWGVKTGEVELPDVEESARKMHSVDVTPDMKESVMEGQPMFRGQDYFTEGETFPIHRTDMQSEYNILGYTSKYSTVLMPDEYSSKQALLDAVRNQYPDYFATIEGENVKLESWQHVMGSAENAQQLKGNKGAKDYVERKTRNAIRAVEYLAGQMGLEVEVLTTTDGLTGKKARAKGFFNPQTGKITLVLPNNANRSDLINTMLHEGVAHYGLRKMFGQNFEVFLDNVYNNVSPEIKARIDAAMKRNKWSRQLATEEYLARLAERTDFEHAVERGWWQKIKEMFLNMLGSVGLRGFNYTLTDNELRYILWRSYDNLLHPDRRRNIFDKAKEVQMKSRLQVGEFAERVRIQRTGRVDTSPMIAAEPQNEEMLNRDIESIPSQELLLSLSQKDDYERNETINELIRRVREGDARIVRMGQEVQLQRSSDAQIAGTIVGGMQQLGLSSLPDEALGSMVPGASSVEGRPASGRENTQTDSKLAIIAWANATGHYYSEVQVKNESPDKKVWGSGAESRVYRSADGKKVIKFMLASDYYQNTLLKHMDGIALHNAVGFEPLTVLGYSLDPDGKLQIVLEQELVDGVTVDEIFDEEPLIRKNNYLDAFVEEELGLIRHINEEGDLYHMKDGIIYRDIHGGNVIVDSKNNHHVIDCYLSREGDDGRDRAPGFSIEDDEERYRLRTKEPPKKTGKGYKVFVLKGGQLYPPMVANPNGEGTPIGVWLDADAAPIAGKSKTGRPQVKAGGKGTQGGSGQLAYRPGWHLGTIPYALQFGRKDANGERTLFPNNFVWAEVEYADDVDYQDEARQEGVNANGKYQHSLAGLKRVPEDGSYRYRTNPNPKTDEWIITGAMRVNRILSREEVDELVRQAGREPQQIQDGDILTQEVVDQLNDEIKATKEADEMGLLYSADEDWNEDDIARDTYEREVVKKSLRWREAWQDSMVGLKAIQDAIARETGKVATGAEDAYRFENRMHGRAKNMTEQYDTKYYRPMLKAFADFCKEKGLTFAQGQDYLISKHGLERNVYYAFRDAIKEKLTEEVAKKRKKLEQDYAKKLIDEGEYKQKKSEIDKLEQTGTEQRMQQVRETLAYQRAKEDYENGSIGYSEYLRRIEDVIRSHTGGLYDKYSKDYSGLTETLAKEWYDDAQKVKRQAQRAVDPRERRNLWAEYDKLMKQAYITARQLAEDAVFSAETTPDGTPSETVTKLWSAINAATEETLKHSYESGMMDRNTYNNVRAMFDYYVPLRGWDENKASDAYTYMGKENVFSPAVKKTWGRTSKAENPLAYIGNIAVSTILSGHRNQMKQHFLNYVLNNPTNLVSISESWYENIGSKEDPIWILRTADTAGKDADEVAQEVNDFNEEMQQKQREGMAMPVRGRLRLDVNATKGQKAEHVVEVQRAGRTYELYINGNPKAAQALNGSAARAVSRISDTYLGRMMSRLNRSMAAFFTSKNPAFVVSNLSRDLTMAGASVAINEGAQYHARFVANVIKVLAPRVAAGDVSKLGLKGLMGKGRGVTGLMPKLMKKWKDGKLDERNETERLFKEFMDEGGETGFVNMLSVDSFKEKMQKEIAQMNGSSLFGSKGKVKEMSVSKGLRLLGETFEFYNRCAEDATRFIVYMTSRQMGKTLEESIADAKDVTLNFNRKGTGGLGNAEVRDLFIFVNPAIQALANMYRMAKGHPLKFGAVTTAFVVAGMLMPYINQWLLNIMGDDDDKDAYWNLPPWVRKNNLVFWIPGTKNFVTIPLAQEFRVFYGVGEMISSSIMEHPLNNVGMEVASSVADLIPINPTGNGGNLMVDFAPTGVQPLIQIGENVDFTGKPIWRDNQGNKYDPMYSKAYISTPQWMTNISEAINNATGGDQDSRGWLERNKAGAYLNNPAVWNHLLQGYFGGMYNTIAKTFDVGVTAAKGELPKIYQTPVINRFLNRPVERDNAGALGEDYWQLVGDTEETMHTIRKKRQRAAEGDTEAQQELEELLQTKDAKRAEVVSHYKSIIDILRKGERSASEKQDKAMIKQSISLYKQQMLEEVSAIDEGKEPLEAAMEQWDKATSRAEKKKLQSRINRIVAGGGKTTTSEQELEKAMQFVEPDEGSNAGSDRYLDLATAENIKADARIKAMKSKASSYTKHHKQLMDEGKTDEAAEYRKENAQWFKADAVLQQQSRLMSKNKKLLGKGHDDAIMKLLNNSRQAMLRVIDGL